MQAEKTLETSSVSGSATGTVRRANSRKKLSQPSMRKAEQLSLERFVSHLLLLTEVQALHLSGMSQHDIATQFGVNQTVISRMIREPVPDVKEVVANVLVPKALWAVLRSAKPRTSNGTNRRAVELLSRMLRSSRAPQPQAAIETTQSEPQPLLTARQKELFEELMRHITYMESNFPDPRKQSLPNDCT